MDNFLTISDFEGLIMIPENNVDTTDADFNAVVSQVQKDILLELLGYELYKTFELGLSEPTPLEKWTNLRDGAELTQTINSSDYLIKFEGVKEMLKGFVFFYFQRRNIVSSGREGNYIIEGESRKPVNFNTQLSEQYNNSLRLYGFDWDMDFCNYQNSFSLRWFNLYYNTISLLSEKIKPTAYNFLKYSNEAEATTYENWIFQYKQPVNHFSI